jgi:hypothetical protein
MVAHPTPVTMRITDYLVADHTRLHALLSDATRTERFDAEAFAAFRRGLLRHIAIEEKLLFPAVKRARDGEPLSRAYELRVDHAALTSLLVPTPDAALCAEIASLLVPHDEKEEGPSGVYAECETYLTPAVSEALAAEAAAFPEVRVAPHFDGPGAHRTAKDALGSARLLKRPQKAKTP